MIELPEAITIAQQIEQTLLGRRIREGDRGNAVHKFAFCNRPPEQYAEILAGKTIGRCAADGSHIIVRIEPGYALVLGGGGERISYHTTAQMLPKKRQLLLRFED